jgi:hypothetical protein
MSPRSENGASHQCRPLAQFGGAGEIRTRDPLLAKQVLYQLSYDPEIGVGCAVKNFSVLDIYFVRSTETRKPKLPSTIEISTEVEDLVSLKRR